tara:strand:- start:1162 stop:1419 length:258 start_codon:yes stop_codon:yes gene_type:complete
MFWKVKIEDRSQAERLLATNLTLTEVLKELGYRHEQTDEFCKITYAHDVFNKNTGELVFTGTAADVVDWLCPGFWEKYHGEEQHS